MWIAKGTLLALWLFGFGTLGLFYFAIYRHLPPNGAVGVTVFRAYTLQNPFWWAALIGCFLVGFAVARAWTGPLGVWIALVVSGLVPAGCLALFLALIYKLKHFSPGVN